MILRSILAFGCLAFASIAHAQVTPPSSSPSPLPNVVLILVDDAALMDFGVYGGEARTPNIDALAARGALFTQYRTSPLCSPTRAMLLTGIDNHQTGVATIPEVLPAEQKGKPGYTMALEPGVFTLADRLRSAGYRTLMSGKWHLGEAADEMPHKHGFDRSFALAASGADNWDDKSYMPYYKDAPWWEDGRETDLPEDFYSSQFIVDKMISYLGETDAEKPFFAYLAFQAIHIPVQAPPEFTAHYDGVYDDGWHALRAARHERAQDLSLIPEGAPLAPMQDDARRWTDLTDAERSVYAARMEVNAGMMEAMDHHIGRFIDHLKAQNAYENTIFVVTSDNGPEPNRGDRDWRLALWMRLNGYHINEDGIGERGSWGFIGTEWATAAASPGAYYKFYATEGGIRAPLIVAGPGIAPTRITSAAMVTDIAPTLLEWIEAPAAPAEARPITGRSLLPLLSGEAQSVYGPEDIRVIEVSGNTALYKGDYKITRSMRPLGDASWGLFNMAVDPGETRDLSGEQPEILADLLGEYERYAADMGVLEMPEGYDSIATIAQNATRRVFGFYGGYILAFGAVFLVLMVAGLYAIVRLVRKMVRKAPT